MHFVALRKKKQDELKQAGVQTGDAPTDGLTQKQVDTQIMKEQHLLNDLRALKLDPQVDLGISLASS
jgi:hypothetical protein